MKQLADVKKANVALMESQRALQNKVEDLAHERERLLKRVAVLEEALRDVQSSRDQLTTDKERYLQEAVKLTKQMQVMTFDADNMQRVSAVTQSLPQ
ncbi:hypothetical protein NP493_730g00027 [Ridgeia piscesae]|uniref:Uncharacterized protein n=1 Tax=Ridgeia piscesae TaxID=27915 RepID=A0AAD9NP25_RIDPI|nr:hypothetical protein NP493_730g00027 [Ridgeia piscesae]